MADLTPTVLLDGITFPEGPRWRDGWLYFSDIPAAKVMRVDPSGRAEVVVTVPERPSGLGWTPDGRMLIVSVRGRKLLRLDPEGLTTVADLSGLAPHECNDMVVDAQGRAYIGHFGFDMHHGARFQPSSLLLATPDGRVRVAADELRFPNGCVITPDGRTLILAETFGRRLTTFDIAADGSLSNRRQFARIEGASPDGICLDAKGGVWVASPTSHEFVRVEDGGAITDRIPTGEDKMAIACMLGGDDRRTLFLCTAGGTVEDINRGTTMGYIETVRVAVPGAGLP